jgi:pimeloyl-ACP methyl ester carboxylesterase
MTTPVTAEFADVRTAVGHGRQRLDMAGLANYPAGGRPQVIWLHANGFNARTYLNTLTPLSDRMAILIVDQRGHGATPQVHAAEDKTDALDMRDDLLALLEAIGDGAPVVLSGHSMGGCVSLLAAAEAPERVRGIALFDPVILGRAATEAAMKRRGFADSEGGLIGKARSRRREFPSRDAAFENYRQRSIFRTWPEAALRDYVEAGFRDLADGTVELACAPEWEAANFAAHGHDIWAAMARVEAPVRIWRAEEGSTCSIASAGEFPRPPGQVEVTTVADSTHFLPIERPDVVQTGLLEVVGPGPD